MVPPKTQNTIQMIFFSTCYVVLKGVKATYLNPYLRLHTVWKKRKRNSFVTQNLCRIDMVKEIRKTVKTMPKWKLKGMQYQWSALSPELLWRSGAAELELNPEGFSSGMAQRWWRREVIWGLRGLWGQGPSKRVGHSADGKQAARELSEVCLGFQVENHFHLESSSTVNDKRDLKKFVLFHLFILQLRI